MQDEAPAPRRSALQVYVEQSSPPSACATIGELRFRFQAEACRSAHGANEFKLTRTKAVRRPTAPSESGAPRAATLIWCAAAAKDDGHARKQRLHADKWVFLRQVFRAMRAPGASEPQRNGALLRKGAWFAAAARSRLRGRERTRGGVSGGGRGLPGRLAFVSRAITPPIVPAFRRKFLYGRAEAVLAHNDPTAGEELLHTRWFSLDEAEALDLPSITRFVLKEVRARLGGEAVHPPFLRWSRGSHTLERLTS